MINILNPTSIAKLADPRQGIKYGLQMLNPLNQLQLLNPMNLVEALNPVNAIKMLTNPFAVFSAFGFGKSRPLPPIGTPRKEIFGGTTRVQRVAMGPDGRTKVWRTVLSRRTQASDYSRDAGALSGGMGAGFGTRAFQQAARMKQSAQRIARPQAAGTAAPSFDFAGALTNAASSFVNSPSSPTPSGSAPSFWERASSALTEAFTPISNTLVHAQQLVDGNGQPVAQPGAAAAPSSLIKYWPVLAIAAGGAVLLLSNKKKGRRR